MDPCISFEQLLLVWQIVGLMAVIMVVALSESGSGLRTLINCMIELQWSTTRSRM